MKIQFSILQSLAHHSKRGGGSRMSIRIIHSLQSIRLREDRSSWTKSQSIVDLTYYCIQISRHLCLLFEGAPILHRDG